MIPNLFKDLRCSVGKTSLLPLPLLTCDRELPLGADGGGVVAGDAGVVAVVLERHLGDLQGAHELLGVDGDARRGHDLLAVLAPRDAYGHVAGRHHAGNVHQLADGRRREVERLDERRNCEGTVGAESQSAIRRDMAGREVMIKKKGGTNTSKRPEARKCRLRQKS